MMQSLSLALTRPSKSQVRLLLCVGLLALSAVLLNALPFLGTGGHMHWVLWMVATGRMDIPTGVGAILGALPGTISALPWMIEGVQWIVTWVAYDGITAIGTILATMSATGWGGIIIGILGVSFIG